MELFSGTGQSIFRIGSQVSDREESTRPYEENVWVRAAIKAIASGFQRMPLRLYDRDPDEEEAIEIESHPFLELLADPSPIYTTRAFWFAHVVGMKLDGEAVWFLADQNGQPVASNPGTRLISEMPAQIIPVRGGLVEVDHNAAGMPDAYRYSTTYGQSGTVSSAIWPAASVVHFRDHDPYNVTRGLGDAECVARETDLYFQSFRAMDASVRNGGIPTAFISYQHEVAPAELERQQDVADEEYSGANQRRVKYLAGDPKITVPNVTPSDMQYPEQLRWMRDSVLASLGVPPPCVGVYDQATYDNVSTAYRQLWVGSNGILSLGESTADVVTNGLLPRLPRSVSGTGASRVIAAFDSSHIEEIQEDKSDKIIAARDLAASGIGLSMNEALERLGADVEAFEEGDRKWMTAALSALGDGDVEAATDAVDEGVGVGASATADPQSTLNGAQIASFLTIIEQVSAGAITKDTAIQLIVASFPFDEARANRILRDVEEGEAEEPVEPDPDGDVEDADENDGDDSEDGSVDSGSEDASDDDDIQGKDADDLSKPGVAVAYNRETEGDPKLAEKLVLWLSRYERDQTSRLRRIANGGLRGILELDNVYGPDALSEEAWDALLLSETDWAQKLDRDVRVALRNVWIEALKIANGEVTQGALVTTDHPDVIRQLASQRIKLTEGVTSTTTRRVRNAIARVMTKQKPAGSLRQMIKDVLPELTDDLKKTFGSKEARATAIARTETGAADNGARFTQYAESDVETIKWAASQDEVTRATHAAVHGQEVALGATFDNGLTRPHDPSAPAGEVVNCRCRTVVGSYRNPFEGISDE